MAIGQQPFAVRAKLGEWAEDTVTTYFNNHPETEIAAFPYGERWRGKRKAMTDAANRPDLLLVSKEQVANLSKIGIDVQKLQLRTLPDTDPQLRTILAHSLVALETKISFRYYVKGHVNFIIDEQRKERYRVWLSRTERIGDIVAWFTLDKVFIAPMKTVLTKGKPEVRSYESRGREARKKKTWNLPVEEAILLADVQGVKLNETLRASMDVGKSGGVTFSVDDGSGLLVNVDLKALLDMADGVKR